RGLAEIPEEVRTAVRNHGGGHYNHSLFWTILKKDVPMPDALTAALTESFGSTEEFQQRFSAAAAGVFGSGWAWLVVRDGKLDIVATQNQDCPLSQGLVPVLGIDVWEHAYYLKYRNRRADYIAAFFHVINWENVAARLRAAREGQAS
ncbi:superoxide dismutase, partial [Candidatus Parcubacteria bacterium]